jgi:hypothetical protein
MKFMISVIDSKTRSPHTKEEIAAIDAVNEEMIKGGYRVLAEGIDSPSKASVFDFTTGSSEITSGPFVRGEEFFSGLWIIDVPNEEIAREFAEKGSRACNRKVELRPLLS